jgi:hypothetical protein
VTTSYLYTRTLSQDDGGKLVVHRTLFGIPLAQPVSEVDPKALPNHSVTELCYFPDTLGDGPYILNLQVCVCVCVCVCVQHADPASHDGLTSGEPNCE